MANDVPTEKAIDALLQECENLRGEIRERGKIAFSHLGYVGAILAFSVPVTESVGLEWNVWLVAIGLVGLALLGYVSYANWMWVKHCSAYLAGAERTVNEYFGWKVLGWEQYAQTVVQQQCVGIPKTPQDFASRLPREPGA